MTTPTDYARKNEAGEWELLKGAFTIKGAGKSTVPVNPDLPNGPKHEVTYDLQFPHNWLECSTAENRAEWGIKAIIPADSVDEDALILRTEIIDLDGRPKYRSVVEPQA